MGKKGYGNEMGSEGGMEGLIYPPRANGVPIPNYQIANLNTIHMELKFRFLLIGPRTKRPLNFTTKHRNNILIPSYWLLFI